VPESWVRRETRAGRLPHLELGRYRRYECAAVLEWLEEKRGGRWRKHEPKVSA
jgi:glutathione S-transferase